MRKPDSSREAHPSATYEEFIQVTDGMLCNQWGPSDRLNSLYLDFCLSSPETMQAAWEHDEITVNQYCFTQAEYRACLRAFYDRYQACFGIDPLAPESAILNECLTASAKPSRSSQLGAGPWGAKLIERLHDIAADYEDVVYPSDELTNGSLYQRQQQLDVFESGILEQGFVAGEPSMSYLAARFCEVSPDIRYPMTMQNVGAAGTRRMYLLACKEGSVHALLYVAWLLATGCKPELFEKNEELAQRFLTAAKNAGAPIESLAFPELAFLEDVELYSIKDAIEDFEIYGTVPIPGKPGHVTYDPLPNPSWHTWNDWCEYLDELFDAVFLYHTTPEGHTFATWCAEQNVLRGSDEN